MKEVDYRFKVFSTISILAVVIGHTAGGINILFSDWIAIYAWHMPAFSFVSGYFYKDDSEKEVSKYVLRKVKRLIVPLFIYNFLYGILVFFLSRKGFTIGLWELNLDSFLLEPIIANPSHQLFGYNLATWYVFPLFLTEITNVFIRKIILNKKYKDLICVFLYVIIGLIGVYLASEKQWHKEILCPLYRVTFLLFFYGLGIFYKRILEKYDVISNFTYFFIIFIIEYVLIYVYGNPIAYSVLGMQFPTEYENIVIPFFIGILGIAFWLRVSKILEASLGKSKAVNLIADSSFSIMANQFLGFMFIKTGFFMISNVTPFFQDFDVNAFKTNLYYYYYPDNIVQTGLLYVWGGVVIPIFIQKIVTKCKSNIKMYIRKKFFVKKIEKK